MNNGNGTKMKILLMFASAYSVVGEGKTTEGCSINYFPLGENGELLEPKNYLGVEGPAGMRGAKASLSKECRLLVEKVPGIYEATFIMTINSDGQIVNKPVNLEYIGDVEFIYHMRHRITDDLGYTEPIPDIKPAQESTAQEPTAQESTAQEPTAQEPKKKSGGSK